MPKVTKEHLQARRAQIISAAGICFAQNGFQRTTVRDICKQAGLSTGAVYGYFESKDAIIQALADENVRQNKEEFAKLRQCSSFRDALKGFVEILLYFKECNSCAAEIGLDVYKMKVSLWAECIRNPEALRAEDAYSHAVSELQKIVRRAQRKGEVRKGLDSKTIAQVLISLLEGFTIQQAIDGRLNTEKYVSGTMALLEGGVLESRRGRRSKA